MYLNHEDGDGNAFLASSFDGFMQTWVPLACPGPDFDDLEVFYDFDAQELSLNTAESRAWLHYLNSK